MPDILGGRPDCCPACFRSRATPGRGDSTQAFSTATLRPFWQRERCGGPREACDAKDQRCSAAAPGGWGDEPPAAGTCGGCSKTAISDCLRRAQVAGLTDWPVVAGLDEGELEVRLYPSQANQRSGAADAPGAGLGGDAHRTRAAGSPGDARPAMAGVQGRAARRVSVLAVLRPVPAIREEALGGVAPGAPRRGEDLRRLL